MTGKQIVEENTKSAEYWKDKAREIMGENTASLIVNTAITVAADGMNSTVAMVDTAGDLLAALVTCAAGESYCTQAKSDLKETNDKYHLNKLMIDSKVGSDGARMTDLVSALNKQGLNEARFISKTSIETLSSVTSNGNPAIVALKLGRGYHAVVVDGITVRNGQPVVAIRDPAGGRQYFTLIDEFKSKFTGQAIFTNSK